MISRLRGTLISKIPPTILIDVQGVGYEVDVPMTSLYDLPEIGESILLHTHLSIREDAHQLFGFVQEIDRRLFRELIKVNGIGGRSALAILSGMNAQDFIQCILQEKLSLLTQVPGIGKKTAERLIIEMRDRLKTWDTHSLSPLFSGEASTSLSSTSHIQDEAIAALSALGYRPQDAQKMIEKCDINAQASPESLIREALKKMASA